jgi:hypothetical protein
MSNIPVALPIVCATLLGLAACGSNEVQSLRPETATLEAQLAADVTLAGHSLKITGQRANPVTDGAYAGCADVVDECFDIGDDAHLVFAVENLCPSSSSPPGTWTFQYGLYTASGCDAGTGTLLNPEHDPANFACYDWTDPATAQDRTLPPNITGPSDIDPGVITRSIVCLTQPLTVDWALEVCRDDTVETDEELGTFIVDCGCEVYTYGGAEECRCPTNTPEAVRAANPADCTLLVADGCRLICWGESTDNAVYLELGLDDSVATLVDNATGPAPVSAARTFAHGFRAGETYRFELRHNPTARKLTATIHHGDDLEVSVPLDLPGDLPGDAAMNSVRILALPGVTVTVNRIDGEVMNRTAPLPDGVPMAAFHTNRLGDGFLITGSIHLADDYVADAGDWISIHVGQNLR